MSVAESISDAPHSFDRDAIDLLAQLPNMDVDGPGLAKVLIPPHRFENLVAGERNPLILGEKPEEVELAGGGCLLPPGGCGHGAFATVDLEACDLQDSRLPDWLFGAPQHRFDPCHQLPWRKGLGDVVVSTQLQAEHFVDLAIAGGEHQYRDLGELPDATTGLDTVHSREVEIEQDHRHRPDPESLDCFFAG